MLKWLVTGLMFSLLGSAGAQQDGARLYVGKSKCISELSRPVNRYGIRLDSSQRADLEAFKLKDMNLLTIVQYASGNDHCGVIRDAVESPDTDASFVWECRDPNQRGEVIIGTWPAKYRGVSRGADKAWAVNLKDLKFVPLKVSKSIECSSGDYVGTDSGGDLASWAKEQTSPRSRSKGK